MAEPIRVGIIGLGWVATHRHVPAIRRSGRFELIGVADRNPALARHWGERLGVRHCTASAIDQVEWLDDVDALDVATSPMSHHGLIFGALQCGKHVITEKPFAMSRQEGQLLEAAARESGLTLNVVHNFQFAPATLRLLRDLESGRIGPVRSIVATQWGNPSRRLPSWYQQLPGGLFYDESPHLLYLMRRLAGGELRLQAVDACASTTDNVTPSSLDVAYRVTLPHGDIPVTMSCRFESPLSEWHIAVLGDRGAGLLDVFRNIYIHLPNDGAHGAAQVVRTSLAATWSHWVQHLTNGPAHFSGRLLYGNERVFRDFGDAIRSSEPSPHTSASDARGVLEMQWDILDTIHRRDR
ncbi:Gfo/Idh/MocA family oxidoreductase [Pseudoxanthomonas sp.]|uniref:Gfo/Idh/MocA family protein n=1 Tax=Pseudoxanthomonas sp. TaxID=1871049 RepID=UPI00258BCF40|nr:Gfo/Idh/MocA family oxidoreductase [Pseudoxanthomonas sp.]MCR6686408.1 Gfo/Idh/MocA family oxidoreductase [Pseudoxanthomonas sp.]